jgi:predicted outer membrane repeat protein
LLFFRSGGAELSNLAISGCNGSAINVQVDATGAFTDPAILTNITISGNSGTQGSALYVGPTASATLQSVTISGNRGPEGVVFAAARSGLGMTHCSINGNNGSAVVFAGSSLIVTGSNFTSNTATGSWKEPPTDLAAPPAAAAAAAGARRKSAGGALRLLCFEHGPGGYDSVIEISNSSFSGNRGLNGGAVYAGEGTTLRMQAVVFSNNSGLDGGAVFADRDACIEVMTNTSFTSNAAKER